MMDWKNREVWAIWTLALFWLLLYVASMLYHTGGRLSLPLDDSFIYFQYAKQAAAGHFLEYNTWDAPTAGATSLLYLALLVPAFWLGLDGMGIAVYALILGWALLGLSAQVLLRLGERLGGGYFSGRLAALLFLLCGPLLWGFYSGMEIGLFSFSILLTLYLFAVESPKAPAAATLMVLARPEGIVLVGLLLAVVGFRKIRLGQASGWQWWLPIAAYAGQGALVAWLTGSPGSAGMAAKWRFVEPHASWPELVRLVLFDYAEFIKGILAGSLGHQTSANLYAYDSNYRRVVFAPFAALFFLAEAGIRLCGEVQERRPGPGLLACGWFLAGTLATCTLVEYDAHFNRYQQPFLPLYLLFIALGLGRLADLGGDWAWKLSRGLACFFCGWGLLSAVFFAVAYGENSSDIRNQQIAMAHFIDANLPPDARIAINDAGALRYFGKRQTVDLVGLTSAGFSGAWREGSGSVYERLAAMSPDRRPDFFAIFPNWFNFPEGTFLHPLHRIRVLEPSIIDAEKVLYRADWERNGDAIRNLEIAAKNLRLVAEVDVADLDSESNHYYQSQVQVPGSGEANLLMALAGTGAERSVFIDGGRTVTGGERMVVNLDSGRPVQMVMRTVTGIAQHFAVVVNGVKVAEVELPGGRGRNWRELVIAEWTADPASSSVEIETRPIHFGGSLRPIVSFHYWFLQP